MDSELTQTQIRPAACSEVVRQQTLEVCLIHGALPRIVLGLKTADVLQGLDPMLPPTPDSVLRSQSSAQQQAPACLGPTTIPLVQLARLVASVVITIPPARASAPIPEVDSSAARRTSLRLGLLLPLVEDFLGLLQTRPPQMRSAPPPQDLVKVQLDSVRARQSIRALGRHHSMPTVKKMQTRLPTVITRSSHSCSHTKISPSRN